MVVVRCSFGGKMASLMKSLLTFFFRWMIPVNSNVDVCGCDDRFDCGAIAIRRY